MKKMIAVACVLAAFSAASCDMRSGTAKEEMEKFSGTPTPALSPTPVQTPIAAADIVQVDVNVEGDPVSVQGPKPPKDAGCPKFNRLKVNGSGQVLILKGPCRQIMINGDHNDVTADASMEFVLNGEGNNVKYSRFVNGKRPIVADNGSDNVVEKTDAPPPTSAPAAQKNKK